VEPRYLATWRSGELARRAERAVAMLSACRVCPRDCDVDRTADAIGLCNVGRRARVASYFAHFGEEDCLRGWHGSGTIFFSFCNLRCKFCQNWETSQDGIGEPVSADELAQMMIELQDRGCHNINFVTPEHVVPQVLEALPIACARGLRVPLVYNTSAYDSLDSLALLDGVVDIYMPDFKYWDVRASAKILGAKDYPAVARAAVAEMHRQVGDLVVDDEGLAVRGLLVRHLVMPDALADTTEILGWLAALSAGTYVNVMDQYRPEGAVLREPAKFPQLARHTTHAEHERAVEVARGLGLRVDERRPHRKLRARLPLLW
jgi:putative pyruvate formate lyase activating enzyme